MINFFQVPILQSITHVQISLPFNCWSISHRESRTTHLPAWQEKKAKPSLSWAGESRTARQGKGIALQTKSVLSNFFTYSILPSSSFPEFSANAITLSSSRIAPPLSSRYFNHKIVSVQEVTCATYDPAQRFILASGTYIPVKSTQSEFRSQLRIFGAAIATYTWANMSISPDRHICLWSRCPDCAKFQREEMRVDSQAFITKWSASPVIY